MWRNIWCVISILLVAQTANSADRHCDPKEREDISSNLNKFALSLYQAASRSTGDGENIFFSPFSISTAVSMVWTGAKGDTAKQIAHTLHLKGSCKRTAAHAIGGLAKKIKVFNQRELDLANRIYIADKYSIRSSFVRSLLQRFGSETINVNFKQEGTRKNINQWVQQTTNNAIKDLLPPGSLDSLTKLVLVNAIHFKSNWHQHFEEAQPRKFYREGSSGDVIVPMMRVKGLFQVGQIQDLDSRVLELPYAGFKSSMLIILPKKPGGLSHLESQITSNRMLAALENTLLINQTLEVIIPKFKVQKSLDLKKILNDLGMTYLFDVKKADLSGISRKDLYVSQFFHKAAVEIHERGTEAAAATYVGISSRSSIRPVPPEPFIADRPFLFFIRDNLTKTIIFAGRLSNPTP